MDPRKCTLSGGVTSLAMAPSSILNKLNEKAQFEKEERDTGHAIEAGVDIDIREVYFLIMHFLSLGPCQRTFEQFGNDLLEHQLLPRRYHAWFSRSGIGSDNSNEDATSFPLSYSNLVERYPHIERDHLVKLLKKLLLSIATPLHGKVGRSALNAADVPTLLGTGSFSLLDGDRNKETKRVKPLPAHLRWPYMQADQVHGLNLREIGGGFTKHHRAPSIRSACYAIAKPSTMVQKMNNKKKLRGHRNAVYCAIFDRSGRYVITGADDRLVKIWSMETALCLASCRGHEGDITDLAVSSNNALVASASNDFSIRVWRLPDGFPISVLQGHTGAVTAIAFSPRLSAVYQLLSSSDDGTCRIWDARSSQCPLRVYMPKPSETSTGKSNAFAITGSSSSNGPQSHQILCCAYNANGTVFVTGSSDTFARVWNALKSNTDNSEQPIHEMDVLAGHENDVNYVQFRDGTSIVLSDDVGQIYLINTGEGESQKDAEYDQFFLGDYRPLARDEFGYLIDQETQLSTYRRNLQDPLCDSSMIPYPEPYQSTYQQRRLGALGMEWRRSSMKFSVGVDINTGQDYMMPPLPDLERMIEPLPDFIDAMLWEPENEVVSEDTDSEYNVTDENSSEGEKGNISTSSSSDPDCSEEDGEAGCSHKDSLRRSRRKRPKVESFERRVKKRRVGEHDRVISGINKTKITKGGRKVSKWKSSKAKTLRPQRVAARNSRTVFSQNPGTSTEGEADDWEDDSSNSESLQQEFHTQSSDGDFQIMQRKHTKEEPSLHEFGNISQPLVVSSSQSNVRRMPKLVFKIKKQEAPKDVKLKDNNQADFVSPSSRCQDATPDNQIINSPVDPDSSSANLVDLNFSRNLLDNDLTDTGQTEKNRNSLEASASYQDSRVRLGEVKVRTPKHTRSVDPMPIDVATGSLANFNAHIEEMNNVHRYVNPESDCEQFCNHSKKGKENYGVVLPCRVEERTGTRAFEDLDGLRSRELSHTDGALVSSSFDSSALGEHKQKGIEGSLEIQELGRRKHSGESRNNASLKFPAENLTSSRDLIPDDSSSMDPNSDLGVLKVGEGAGRSTSLKFVCKHRINSEGSGGKVEEYATNINDHHDSGMDLPAAATNAIRGTRTLKIKETSWKVDSMSHSPKLRWGHQTVGTSKDAEDSSAKLCEEIHQRPRSTRGRQGGSCTDYGQSSSTRSMLVNPAGKLPWLMLSKHEDGYRYIPQLGDEVVYLRQGHQEYLKLVNNSEEGPWESIKENIKVAEVCKVESLEYASLPGSGESCCKIKLKFVDPSSAIFGKALKLTLPEIDFNDFIVEKTWYDASIRRNWTTREECAVWWRDSISDGGGTWWVGQIIRCQPKSHEFPDSPWLRYEVRYENDDETHLHCPWELREPSIVDDPSSCEQPHIDSESKEKLLRNFYKLQQKDFQTIQQLNQAVQKADFCNSFPVQLYPELIQSRLENDYYRSLEAVKHDITVMLTNGQYYFKRNELQARIRHISKRFKKKLSKL
ncbi:hypothetical protein C1H46_030252 [Malus baccata]|uniref:Uncharacterized protein n=1 Tax=Malus baccata TaxID=106549 RepID=A0A540LD05_MALBA|nr:hypothetical protein C1H46_030252 [Malus baccata]